MSGTGTRTKGARLLADARAEMCALHRLAGIGESDDEIINGQIEREVADVLAPLAEYVALLEQGPPPDDTRVSLTKAAAALRRSYNQVQRLVIVGALQGGQDERGRWWVDADDLLRYAREEGQ